MRKHNGMRPQDIVVLLKLAITEKEPLNLSRLSNTLFLSLSEVSESVNRSEIAKLVDYKNRVVFRQNLMEFIEHGVKYVFPQRLGSIVRGLPTAHSHPFMQEKIGSETFYVWPDHKGSVIGMELLPFYGKQVEAAKQDSTLYKLLALVDVLRVGKTREVKLAILELKKILLNES
ncbi:MAG: hypothetical protein SFU20_09545 [Chitinophagaceae bacterium]|nr:hypothetical protein [Chitinophagaceae bacterium]